MRKLNCLFSANTITITMTTAAMMRASTATNAPATDVTVVDVVIGGVLGVSVLKEENIKLMLRNYHFSQIISQMHTKYHFD